MTTNLKHSVSIEQYLANEMAPTERSAFRKELRSNPELAKELKLSQSIDSALVRDDIIDLRQKLIAAINANRTVKADVPVVRMYTRKWWYAAASFLVLCAVAATLFLQTNRNISNDALFSQYYNSENIVDQTRGDQNILEAVIKFQQKDFVNLFQPKGRVLYIQLEKIIFCNEVISKKVFSIGKVGINLFKIFIKIVFELLSFKVIPICINYIECFFIGILIIICSKSLSIFF